VKRVVFLLLAATLAGSAVASARTAKVPTKTPGVLTIAFGDSAVGFASYTLRGNNISSPRGYEVDIAKAVAAKLGLKTKFVYTPWAGLFAPGTKKFDVSFQEATITTQRKKTVTFSSPYLDSNQGVLLSKQAKTPKSIADLKKLKTCAQTGTTGLDWINTHLHPTTKPQVYQATAAAFTAVQIGKCDALILDVPIVLLQKKAKPGAYGKVGAQVVTQEKYGAVFQKGSALATAFDHTLAQLKANGTIKKLQKKWFQIDTASIPVLK
jgi:polar amino acid transport system substrate-binding protein